MLKWFKKKETKGIEVSKEQQDFMDAHEWIWSKDGGMPIVYMTKFVSTIHRNKLYAHYYILNPKTNRWEDRSNND